MKAGQFNKSYKEDTILKPVSLGRMPAKNMRKKNLETLRRKEKEKKEREMNSKHCIRAPLGSIF